MVEVFITNIKKVGQAKGSIKTLENYFPELEIHFDMDETGLPFPCGHTVLRIEGTIIEAERIISVIKGLGFFCEVMEDKIC